MNPEIQALCKDSLSRIDALLERIGAVSSSSQNAAVTPESTESTGDSL